MFAYRRVYTPRRGAGREGSCRDQTACAEPDPTRTPTLHPGLSLSLPSASLCPLPFDLLGNLSATRLPLQRSTDTGQPGTEIQVPPRQGSSGTGVEERLEGEQVEVSFALPCLLRPVLEKWFMGVGWATGVRYKADLHPHISQLERRVQTLALPLTDCITQPR